MPSLVENGPLIMGKKSLKSSQCIFTISYLSSLGEGFFCKIVVFFTFKKMSRAQHNTMSCTILSFTYEGRMVILHLLQNVRMIFFLGGGGVFKRHNRYVNCKLQRRLIIARSYSRTRGI